MIDVEVLKKIRECIKYHGGELYIVGGAVRDYLLGKELPHDIDIVITGITDMFRVKKCLPEDTIYIGKKFPVFRFSCCDRTFDVALTRIEEKNSIGHKGFRVKETGIPIKTDAMRRDFTINSIYMDLDGNIHDPLGGLQDLKKRILRPVNNETFSGDPLRVFRLFRYSTCLDFKISKIATKLVKFTSKKELQSLPIERIIGELKRVYDECPEKFADYILLLDKHDVLRKYYGELYKYMSLNTVKKVNYKELKNNGFEFSVAYSTLFIKIPYGLVDNKRLVEKHEIAHTLYYNMTVNIVKFFSKYNELILNPHRATCYELYTMVKNLIKKRVIRDSLKHIYSKECVEQVEQLIKYFNNTEKVAMSELNITPRDFSNSDLREKFLLMVVGKCSHDRSEGVLKFSKC